jgi:hypothetical protein
LLREHGIRTTTMQHLKVHENKIEKTAQSLDVTGRESGS